jgi:hypothetical protein
MKRNRAAARLRSAQLQSILRDMIAHDCDVFVSSSAGRFAVSTLRLRWWQAIAPQVGRSARSTSGVEQPLVANLLGRYARIRGEIVAFYAGAT